MPDVAVVTGGSRGIGAAIARRCADDGYAVLAAARSDAPLRELARQHPGITACPTDVGRPGDVDELARRAAALGRVAAWINCAAVVEATAFPDLTFDGWRRQLAVNLDGIFWCTSAAFRSMRETGGGVIVNFASLSGVANVEKFPGLAAYNAAKAGVIALSEAVALEGRAAGVRCVCLSPGAVDTEMLRQAAPHLHPGMTPEGVATIVAWLLTDAAAPLSGTNIPIFSNA